VNDVLCAGCRLLAALLRRYQVVQTFDDKVEYYQGEKP